MSWIMRLAEEFTLGFSTYNCRLLTSQKNGLTENSPLPSSQRMGNDGMHVSVGDHLF